MCTSPYDPSQHGLIERFNDVCRETFSRHGVIDEAESKRITDEDFDLVLSICENDINNTLLEGGYSASQRTVGFSTSALKSILDMDLVEMGPSQSETIKKLLEFQKKAREAHLEVQHSEKIKAMIKQREVAKPRKYEVGEWVSYYREADAKGLARWRGPALVLLDNPQQKYYHLDPTFARTTLSTNKTSKLVSKKEKPRQGGLEPAMAIKRRLKTITSKKTRTYK